VSRPVQCASGVGEESEDVADKRLDAPVWGEKGRMKVRGRGSGSGEVEVSVNRGGIWLVEIVSDLGSGGAFLGRVWGEAQHGAEWICGMREGHVDSARRGIGRAA
jgi:hypothetical protein